VGSLSAEEKLASTSFVDLVLVFEFGMVSADRN
jgi:hypothetical protein